jgi:hypothetical protein
MADVKRKGSIFSYENRALGKTVKYKLVDGKFYKIKDDGSLSGSSVNNPIIRAALNKELSGSDSSIVTRGTGEGAATKRPGPGIKQKKQRAQEKAMFPYEYKTTGSDALSTEKLKRTAYSERKPTTPSSAIGRKRTKYKTDVKDKGVPVPPKKPTESGRIKMDEFSALMDTVTKPRGTVNQSKKRPPAQESTPTSTQARVRTKQAKRITAGPNVGFGPKGNIFASNAAERRELMAKYGGTGSAAAKAAAAGKQGNLTKKAAKGGYMKKNKGSMDYRKGGMVMSTVDKGNLKKGKK